MANDRNSPANHSPGEGQIIYSQERLLGIIGSATDAIVTVDDEQRVTLFNSAAERMFGCPAAEAIGQSLDRFIPARFREIHREHIHVFGRTGVTTRAMASQRPLMALRDDGTEFPVEATISQIVVGGQRLFTAIVRDISERKRAEEALRESEERYRALFEYAPDGIVIADPKSYYIDANPSMCRMLGYTRDELIGLHASNIVAQLDIQHIGPALNAINARSGHSREWQFRRKDGSVFAGEVIATLMPDGNLMGMIRDITERKRAEESLGRQAEELARSNVELERFAYVASHDLQEPMRTVQSFAQLLQRNCGESLTGDAEEYLRFIVGGVQRTQALINDLLAYSRVSSQGAAFAPADCNEICIKVLENLRASIESHRAQVTVATLPVVIGDATQLGEVFQNLLVNAIKFHGERTPRIHVSAKETEREWIFSVTDNGIGIAPEYFERIFIIFQRLHTIEEYGGTGIGLAICTKIAERHEGRIWVESVFGQGSTFHFSIRKREKAI